jgi:hypothetical protein
LYSALILNVFSSCPTVELSPTSFYPLFGPAPSNQLEISPIIFCFQRVLN